MDVTTMIREQEETDLTNVLFRPNPIWDLPCQPCPYCAPIIPPWWEIGHNRVRPSPDHDFPNFNAYTHASVLMPLSGWFGCVPRQKCYDQNFSVQQTTGWVCMTHTHTSQLRHYQEINVRQNQHSTWNELSRVCVPGQITDGKQTFRLKLGVIGH